MKKPTLYLISFSSTLALLFAVFLSLDSPNINANGIEPASPAAPTRPEFSLPDLQGNIRHIKEWDGKYIVLNFWATWCPPCRKEIPEFIALQKEYGDSNLQFIGVAIDDAVSVDQYALEMGINYPNLIAEMSGIELARQYGNAMGALPYSVIINPQGKIITRQVGLLDRKKILAATRLSKS
ncbi:MAG: redoxin [Cycloclasticus sp. symbiont of Bathymodiolus heckerae]|nr:MAG: redoxin [Cycloclasticus sp. symbiont of Bathymodiolus heckerae]